MAEYEKFTEQAFAVRQILPLEMCEKLIARAEKMGFERRIPKGYKFK